MDLIDFLNERLDEDERIARGATPGPWRYNYGKQWHAPQDLPDGKNGEEFVAAGSMKEPVCVAATGPANDPSSVSDGLYIARQHPKRALADLLAKRRMILRGDTPFCRCEEANPATDPKTRQPIQHHYDCTAYRIAQELAVSYRRHPDYDEAWLPFEYEAWHE